MELELELGLELEDVGFKKDSKLFDCGGSFLRTDLDDEDALGSNLVDDLLSTMSWRWSKWSIIIKQQQQQ